MLAVSSEPEHHPSRMSGQVSDSTAFSEPVGWKLTTRPRTTVRAPRVSVACHDDARAKAGEVCVSLSTDTNSVPISPYGGPRDRSGPE
jgi:hypothetical protein